MYILHLSILAILIKLNHDDLKNQTCRLSDLLLLTALILMRQFFEQDYSHSEHSLRLWSSLHLGYLLPLLLSITYFSPIVRAQLGSADILFLFAVAPLLPGINSFLVLFIACVLALPSALFKYCRESYQSKDEVRDNSFPFIPYLTLAFFIVRYSQF